MVKLIKNYDKNSHYSTIINSSDGLEKTIGDCKCHVGTCTEYFKF